MTSSSLRAALLWSNLQVLNRERFASVMEVFGSLDEAVKHIDGELLRGLGCREETIGNVMQRLEKFDPDAEEKLLTQSESTIISFADEQYPERLLDVPDAPVFLTIRGDLSVLHQPCIGMVGTRAMSAYGQRVGQEFTRAFVQGGIVTVSGLARGIDSLVAIETMEGGGKTVAVLGQGLLTLSAQAKRLADKIVASGGLVVSEFPLRFPADMFTFPRRNRIIAGLSLATVVLEAPDGSGALITAKLAFDYNRDVFAVPGQIFDANYAGCHALLRAQQAHVAASPRDVLTQLGVVVPEDDEDRSAYVARSPDEDALLTVLSTMQQPVDDIVEKSALPPGTVSATLTILEINGAARNLGNGQWVRC